MKRDAWIAAFVRFMAVGLTLLSGVGCSQDALLQKFASAEDQATAKKYVDDLRTGRYAEIEAVADPSIKGPTMRGTLEQMAGLIPDEEPSSIKLVGAETTKGPGGTIKNLTFEYGFGDKWLLVNLATQSRADVFTIVGFNVYLPDGRTVLFTLAKAVGDDRWDKAQIVAQSLADGNRFGLTGKTPGQYLILALAILLPLLTLYALILCARTKMVRGKWLWIVVILLGVGKVAVNWTTGEWQVTPLAIQLLSVSAFTAGYGPWVVAVSVPLGAILFLFRRRLPLRQDHEA